MAARKQAGTEVLEPVDGFSLDVPAETIGAVLGALIANRAIPEQTTEFGGVCTITGSIPTKEVHDFERILPGLSRGEGVLTTEFSTYAKVIGAPPVRARSDMHPENRALYLALVSQM